MAKKSSKRKAKKRQQRGSSRLKQSSAKQSVEVLEREKVEEILKEASPRIPLKNRLLIAFLVLIIITLLLTVYILASKTASETQNSINTASQEEILNVVPGSGDALQPSGGSDSITPQPSAEDSQEGASAQDLQPQKQITPEQLQQLQ